MLPLDVDPNGIGPSQPAAVNHPAGTVLQPGRGTGRLRLRLADAADREAIFRIRHQIYAVELGQHTANPRQMLTDALDAFNTYIVAVSEGQVAGFVSITPPNKGSYSIDKYLSRTELPFTVDDRLYEIRLLTVLPGFRSSILAVALMYAASRWAESHGASTIITIGRKELVGMYRRAGFNGTGIMIHSGAVTFELMRAGLDDFHRAYAEHRGVVERIEKEVLWELGISFRTPSPCFHGGAFFEAVGEEFDDLERLKTIINADVLDAWFPPSPRVLKALGDHLPSLLRTSPPTGCDGMARAIARARGVDPNCILPGAGSSDLIFLALRHWLSPTSRVLLLDPTYGEYSHVLEKVIGCRVERLRLRSDADYQVDIEELTDKIKQPVDLVVLVNPNSPTGRHIRRERLETGLEQAAPTTRIWIDETYVEYAGPGQSLESFAARSHNTVVCKSMSKVYGLSGVRAAYLCAGPHQLEALRAITPPWAVSLPAQVAAVEALADPEYYAAKYRETHENRTQLAALLAPLGWEVVPSTTNFLLCHLPLSGPDAETLSAQCRSKGLFLRDARNMGTDMGRHCLRIAVKEPETNRKMAAIIKAVVAATEREGR